MRALTTTELEHCAGGEVPFIGSMTVEGKRIYGGFDYNSDAGNGGYDASNASNYQTYDPHSGYGENGDMGYFESIGDCADDPFTCIGYGADKLVGVFHEVIDRLSTKLGTALDIALYSRIGSQMDEYLNNHVTTAVEMTQEELADFFERGIRNGEIAPAQ